MQKRVLFRLVCACALLALLLWPGAAQSQDAGGSPAIPAAAAEGSLQAPATLAPHQPDTPPSLVTDVFTDAGAPNLPGVGLGAALWGDYDSDGWPDILLTGNTATGCTTRIYHNEGNGAFTGIDTGLPALCQSAAAWGDYDNDGRLDIILAGDTRNGLIAGIYHNDGGGSFHDINAGLPGFYGGSVAWGDYDNDSRLDIALFGTIVFDVWFPQYASGIYRNNGDGTFTAIGVRVGMPWGSLGWGDYDNDGWLDLFNSGWAGPFFNPVGLTQFIHNNGDGSFTADGSLNTWVGGAGAWGDYNNDGTRDLFVMGIGQSRSDLRAVLFRNNGDGTFGEVATGIEGADHAAAAWGDYDNDGRLDLLVAGEASAGGSFARVYHNNGDGTFTDIGATLMGVAMGSAAWGACNNDGRLDALVAGCPTLECDQPITTVYRNDSQVASFAATPLRGHPPLAVQFTSPMTTATSHQWSFGDGALSTEITPTHTYTQAGSYTVTLSVTGPGGSSNLARANYVQLYTFSDVPPTHPAWLAIEAVKKAGVTAGCGGDPPRFCPDSVVKREEIAVFIGRALGWPPTPGVNQFGDLASDHWATPFAETLRAHGVTAGCQAAGQPLRYCPLYVLSKAEIATMIRAAAGWAPANPPQYIFADAGPGDWFTPHVEAFYAHTPGSQCSLPGQPLRFCPLSQVSRAYMAELLASAFGL